MSRIIAKVISGGQTGVDVAALRAAKSLGIPTGGTMPKGWRTLDGPRPEYHELYGMVEDVTDAYPSRTRKNVKDAHATIQIARDFNSAGERCTTTAVCQYSMPNLRIQALSSLHVYEIDPRWSSRAVEFVEQIAEEYKRTIVVNFAGNSERTAPGIEKAAERFIRQILESCL